MQMRASDSVGKPLVNAIGRDNIDHTGQTVLFFWILRNFCWCSYIELVEMVLLIVKLPFLSALLNRYACFPSQLLAPCERHNCTKIHNCNFNKGRVRIGHSSRRWTTESESGGEEILFAFFREQNMELMFCIWKLFYILSLEEDEEAEEDDEEEEAISRPLYTPQWNTPQTQSNTPHEAEEKCKMWKVDKQDN